MQLLQQAADERAEQELRISTTREAELTAAENEFHASTERLVKESGQQRRDCENQYAETKHAAREQQRATEQEHQAQLDKAQQQIDKQYKQSVLAIERKKKECEWQALAVFDAAKDVPGQKHAAAIQRLQARQAQIDGLQRDANTLLAMRRLSPSGPGEVAVQFQGGQDAYGASSEERLQTCITEAHRAVLALQSQRLPAMMLEGWRWVGWWLGASLLSGTLAVGMIGATWWLPVIGLAIGGALAALFYGFFGGKARQQSLAQFAEITNWLDHARREEQAAREQAEALCVQQSEAIHSQRNHELAEAERNRTAALTELETLVADERTQAEARHASGLQQAASICQAVVAEADKTFPPSLDQLAQQRRDRSHAIHAQQEVRTSAAKEQAETAWQNMADSWHRSFSTIADELSTMRAICSEMFPDWSSTEWSDWQRPAEPPEAMQFGTYRLQLQAVKHGISQDERLVPAQTELELPALMNFAEQPRLVISAAGAGRVAAVGVLQSMMVRFLTAMPAGKLRFTIIDPAGLGENFASFMHLADFDEQLVGGRILTDSRQIDERLLLLSDHMEKVLQKYLRNQFENLHEYNQHAGEVAEPYHVLVIANFPSGLSDAAIRKLMTIATAGPKCGVYLLMSIDSGIKLPGEHPLDELFADAVHLEWAQDAMRWNYPLYEKLRLELDPLPPKERLTDLLQKVAIESREASRVEVPFDVVAPEDDAIWTGSTAHELVVAMGRAGANELQSLRLGRGTSQHVLISGKTGSGKSTLLHALVTNLALHYSPRELEFYLVDFKKGVEFKAYATGQLPHARVIAIESEREFGVSVLQRLDEELRRRGEKFRELGVQDLAGFRAESDAPMPRVLLMVDEFQELFVNDDKLAQDAALLLDRLVRQGRAFGIHVLLGSQTLAGAYSLARSTLGQMAVRIALECSETDAHLILSDDNMAARLLNRPGEAIYNDQNGMTDGNSLFQVVWLPDEQRQEILSKLRSRAESLEIASPPPIVFEGNVPANPSENSALVSALADSGPPEIAEPTLWLGSAVRIEPPTHVMLRRQAGQNLLVVGQDEPLALGILATSVLALAAQQGSHGLQVTVLDGTRTESSQHGCWQQVVDILPGEARCVSPSGVAEAIGQLSAEVARRMEPADGQFAPHYVVIHDLAQFRNLRLSEDDFSFTSQNSTNGKPPAVDVQFRELLREGPAAGVHVLVWCDSYNNLMRSIDRRTLKEMEYRVALQMSPGDSTSLIDSPAAGRLGEHRAILYRDDLGTQQKFRPYGRPTDEWLACVGEQLAGKKLARS